MLAQRSQYLQQTLDITSLVSTRHIIHPTYVLNAALIIYSRLMAALRVETLGALIRRDIYASLPSNLPSRATRIEYRETTSCSEPSRRVNKLPEWQHQAVWMDNIK